MGKNDDSNGRAPTYDDEPVLKYQRMGADLGQMLSQSKETIVRMTVHDVRLVRAAGSAWLILSRDRRVARSCVASSSHSCTIRPSEAVIGLSEKSPCSASKEAAVLPTPIQKLSWLVWTVRVGEPCCARSCVDDSEFRKAERGSRLEPRGQPSYRQPSFMQPARDASYQQGLDAPATRIPSR